MSESGKSEDLGEFKLWAAMEFEPWPATRRPGPSHEQWMAWNEEHGAMLRIACAVMTSDKEKLGDLAGEFERDGETDSALERYDRSVKFFREMAEIIEAAKLRFLVGTAVHALRQVN